MRVAKKLSAMPSPAPTTRPLNRPAAPLIGISSMATRQLLAELGAAFTQRSGQPLAIEAVGGVLAAQRVQAGEQFDVVVLASDAIARLVAAGHLVAGSVVDLVRSPVALAVRAGAACPDVSTEDAVRQALLAARSVGYSTGPSGAHLAQLIARWGLGDVLAGRTVQAPPGVPVGELVARGEVEIGWQQLSELMHVPGITVLGTLPPAIEFITTFSAGAGVSAGAGTAQQQLVGELLAFIKSPEAAPTVRRHGMQPA